MRLYTKQKKEKEILKIWLHWFFIHESSSKPFPFFVKYISERYFPTPISHGRLNSQSENLFNPVSIIFQKSTVGKLSTNFSPRNPLARKRNRRKAQYGCEPLTSKVSVGCPSPPLSRTRPRSLSIIVIAIYCSPRHRNKQY